MQLRVFTTLAVFVAGTVAQQASLADSLSQIPECAQACIIGAIPDSGCAPTDSSCLCTTGNKAFLASGTTCLLQKSSCSADELQQVQVFAKNACAAVLGSASGSAAPVASAASSAASSASGKASSSASATKNAATSSSGSASGSSSMAASTGGAMQIGASMLAVGAGAIAFVL